MSDHPAAGPGSRTVLQGCLTAQFRLDGQSGRFEPDVDDGFRRGLSLPRQRQVRRQETGQASKPTNPPNSTRSAPAQMIAQDLRSLLKVDPQAKPAPQTTADLLTVSMAG